MLQILYTQSKIVGLSLIFRNIIGLNFGICVPKSCTQGEIGRLFRMIQKRIIRDKAILEVVPDTCQVKEDLNWNLDVADLFALYVFAAQT